MSDLSTSASQMLAWRRVAANKDTYQHPASLAK